MNAVGTLLHCGNRSMNANALLNTLILRRGKVDKTCVQRFQKFSLCLSYTNLLRKQLALTKNYRDPVAKLTDKLFIDLKFRKNPNATFKDRAAELPISNEVKDVVPLLNMSPEEMNTSFFDSNTVNPEMVLINKPLFSSNCSETSSVSSKESSQLGDLETEMNNICLKGAEQFALFENTLEEKVEENLTTDCKLNEKCLLEIMLTFL